MKVGLATVAYHESRFITPFLKHIPAWVDEKLVLLSSKPWEGEPEPGEDPTEKLAMLAGAHVLVNDWSSEEEQRNAGQDWFFDMDWVIWLDPDEFLSNEGWDKLKAELEETTADALVVEGQYTYWKKGYVAHPHRDYQQLIATKPSVRFVDKRVVDSAWRIAYGVWIHHFSWARTDAECWRKISHYAHAKDFDIKRWYDNVWLKWRPGKQDVHPVTPSTLHDMVPAKLPRELEALNLWP